MNIRILFGYLCFILSVLLVTFQFVTLPTAYVLPVPRAIALCVVTVIFLVVGFLSLESPRNHHLTLISVVAFIVCAAALICVAAFAILGPSHMSPAKYIVLVFYAMMFGGFGLAASLLLHGRSVAKQV
jgi:hypothetical protein